MYAGQYGQYNDGGAMHYESATTNSNVDFDQNFGPVQHGMNTFSSSLLAVEETSVSGTRGGRTTRSSRGRGGNKLISMFSSMTDFA